MRWRRASCTMRAKLDLAEVGGVGVTVAFCLTVFRPITRQMWRRSCSGEKERTLRRGWNREVAYTFLIWNAPVLRGNGILEPWASSRSVKASISQVPAMLPSSATVPS